MTKDDRESRLARLGVPAARRDAVTTWLSLLETWNARIDLTAARGDDELCDLMLADALVLAERVPAQARVVDVGAGAGAPGLALALLRPDLSVTLVEPLAKRVAFLRTVVGTLGRTDVTLRAERGEAIANDAFDVALSRATLAPAAWIAMGLRVAPRAWAFLAKDDPPPGHVVDDVRYAWPLTGAARRAVLYGRAGS